MGRPKGSKNINPYPRTEAVEARWEKHRQLCKQGIHNWKGRKHSSDTKIKMSESAKARAPFGFGHETRKRMSESAVKRVERIGIPMSKPEKSLYKLKNPEKYVGRNPHRIVARSSWERKLMVRFDTDPNVIAWSSESIIVKYKCPVKGHVRNYYPDFMARIRQSDGSIRELIIEVKPKKQTKPPIPQKRMTKWHMKEIATYAINLRKWEAAQAYAAAKGMDFMIMTEDHLGVREVS